MAVEMEDGSLGFQRKNIALLNSTPSKELPVARKLSHRQWRSRMKKQKRKCKRQQLAVSGGSLSNGEINEPVSGDSDIENEERSVARDGEETERRRQHEAWLERERLAELAFAAKREREERERRLQDELDLRIKAEWAEDQRRTAEQAKVDAEKKSCQAELLKQARADRIKGSGEGPTHNPDAPYNPERGDDRPPCPFFSKVGACRFNDRCSRSHTVPETSCTLLFPAMFLNFGLEQSFRDEFDSDMTLEYEDADTYHQFVQFYRDVLPEFKAVGRVVQFKVCCNHEQHLRGNVYVQYSKQSEALAAYERFNGRWYASRQLSCQVTCVNNWKAAICGLFHRKRCPKGRHCNFMHVFLNPRGEFSEMDRTNFDVTPDVGRDWSQRRPMGSESARSSRRGTESSRRHDSRHERDLRRDSNRGSRRDSRERRDSRKQGSEGRESRQDRSKREDSHSTRNWRWESESRSGTVESRSRRRRSGDKSRSRSNEKRTIRIRERKTRSRSNTRIDKSESRARKPDRSSSKSNDRVKNRSESEDRKKAVSRSRQMKRNRSNSEEKSRSRSSEGSDESALRIKAIASRRRNTRTKSALESSSSSWQCNVADSSTIESGVNSLHQNQNGGNNSGGFVKSSSRKNSAKKSNSKNSGKTLRKSGKTVSDEKTTNSQNEKALTDDSPRSGSSGKQSSTNDGKVSSPGEGDKSNDRKSLEVERSELFGGAMLDNKQNKRLSKYGENNERRKRTKEKHEDRLRPVEGEGKFIDELQKSEDSVSDSDD